MIFLIILQKIKKNDFFKYLYKFYKLINKIS